MLGMLVMFGNLLACTGESSAVPAALPFADITSSFGGAMDVHHLPRDFCDHVERSAPPGICMFDFDNDGDVDLFATDLEGHANRLYENDGEKLVEVTAGSGLEDDLSDSIGCLAFDFDSDGDLDLLVTNNGPDRFFRNEGGRFSDVTEEVGLVSPQMSTTATAGDIDGDGDLDLFIGRFLDGSTCDNGCFSAPYGCTPYPDSLYENREGQFIDVTAERGVVFESQTLASLFFDVDRDGDLDLFIGTDTGLVFFDRMLLNDGNGTFVDNESIGLGRGDSNTMGVAIGDVDGNGVSDLVVSDFQGFASPLFKCEGSGPSCREFALEWDGVRYVRFSVALEDFDGDGDLDAFQTTGHVAFEDPSSPNLLSINDGTGTFENYVPDKDDPLSQRAISRGAVLGDLDNDGDKDIVIANAGSAPQILRNDMFIGGSIGVDVGTLGAGARVRVVTDARDMFRDVVLGTGFLGSQDPRLFFGIGDAAEATIIVEWLSGEQTVIEGASAGQVHVVMRP